jgi:hypothetical protein
MVDPGSSKADPNVRVSEVAASCWDSTDGNRMAFRHTDSSTDIGLPEKNIPVGVSTLRLFVPRCTMSLLF